MSPTNCPSTTTSPAANSRSTECSADFSVGADHVQPAWLCSTSTDAKPKLRYTAGPLAGRATILRRLDPAGIFDQQLANLLAVTDQFRLEGSGQVRDFLALAFTAVEDVRFHTTTGEGDAYSVFYRAQLGSQPFEDAQLLRLDDEARIKEITLFARPMPALTALMLTVGPKLARQQGRRGLAALMRASAWPVHAMVSFGDRRVVPLTRPAAQRT
ncbi:hypothetical protein AB0E69_33570 [Kribbella sp. NPDC026611]|uniref:hypothetical protein n=1 Tax=Kribbella sp. NPDC026611 TaxID=3154911 RepID=UPI0033E32AE6